MSDASETPPPGVKASYDTSLTLLERLRTNEPDAWRIFVHLYNPLLYHWCSRAGLQSADADDVVQDVLRSASAYLASYRHDRAGDTFRGWLRVVTRNAIRMHFRRSGRQVQASGGTGAFAKLQEVADADSFDWPDAGDEPSEVDGVRRRALELVRSEFEERTWQMFWLTFVEDRSPVDVAADMAVSAAAVRKAKSRVLRRHKEQFSDLLS